MLVIINADDLGESQRANNIIFELMHAKQITSTTLFANGPYLNDAIKKIPYFQNFSFGVHLNISAYQPLSQKSALRVLLDKNGFFIADKIREVKINPSLSNAIYMEFCSQIEKLFSLGVKISHVDSHYHIHNMPKIFPILKRVQKRYGLRKVRISKNIYASDVDVSKTLLIKKKIYNFMLRHCYSTKTTYGFTDLLTFYKNSKLKKMLYKTIEIVVHPQDNEIELNLLRSPWQKELPFTMNFINYNEL